MQDLVKANGFIKGFSSITADSNADQALLYTGKAAMMLHGAWTYGSMKTERRRLRLRRPPRLHELPAGGSEHGKGDPSDTVGNPGQYLSISSKATDAQKEIAKKFFGTTGARRHRDQEVGRDRQRAARQGRRLPVPRGSRTRTSSSSSTTSPASAKIFAQSWDQALSPTAAETLLDNIAKLFQLSDHPAAVGRQHEQGHRPMTAARTAGRPGTDDHQRAAGAKTGAVTWMALPALVIFVAFGVIPLLGVLVLSFTTWDGIGVDPPVRPHQLARASSTTPVCRTPSG